MWTSALIFIMSVSLGLLVFFRTPQETLGLFTSLFRFPTCFFFFFFCDFTKPKATHTDFSTTPQPYLFSPSQNKPMTLTFFSSPAGSSPLCCFPTSVLCVLTSLVCLCRSEMNHSVVAIPCLPAHGEILNTHSHSHKQDEKL